MLKGKYVALNAYIRKEESLTNNQISHLENLETEDQIKRRASGRKEIMKIRAEVNEI